MGLDWLLIIVIFLGAVKIQEQKPLMKLPILDTLVNYDSTVNFEPGGDFYVVNINSTTALSLPPEDIFPERTFINPTVIIFIMRAFFEPNTFTKKVYTIFELVDDGVVRMGLFFIVTRSNSIKLVVTYQPIAYTNKDKQFKTTARIPYQKTDTGLIKVGIHIVDTKIEIFTNCRNQIPSLTSTQHGVRPIEPDLPSFGEDTKLNLFYTTRSNKPTLFNATLYKFDFSSSTTFLKELCNIDYDRLSTPPIDDDDIIDSITEAPRFVGSGNGNTRDNQALPTVEIIPSLSTQVTPEETLYSTLQVGENSTEQERNETESCRNGTFDRIPNAECLKLYVESLLDQNQAKLKETIVLPPRQLPSPSNKELEKLFSIGYGSLVFAGYSNFEYTAYNLPTGSLVFIEDTNKLMLKINTKKNSWRVISFMPDEILLPIVQTTIPPPSTTQPLIEDTRVLHLVALATPVPGSLKTMSRPSQLGYSGVSYSCQTSARARGLKKPFFPVLNTNMYDKDYLIPPEYRNTVPIVNIKGQRIFDSFGQLSSKNGVAKAPIFDFNGKNIAEDLSSSCIWMGSRPVYIEGQFRQDDLAQCKNWQSSLVTDKGLALRIPKDVEKNTTSFLTNNSTHDLTCSSRCFVLCVQLYPV